MLPPNALIFDFDGVLIESEFESNRHLARLLTEFGHPTSAQASLSRFAGLAGQDFVAALEDYMGGPVPERFKRLRTEEMKRALQDGIVAVEGAIEFVRSLPASLPKAVASSSRSEWIRTHLDKLGLADCFGDHLYSGAEHVERGKPAPDLYIHAALELGVPIGACAIIEDSEVGATGALRSGATVIGLVAGSHCLDGHAARLQSLGVEHIAASFDELGRFLRL